jgi:DNA-binding NtrC family response regulator
MGAGPRKILVVDDDMLILMALSRACRSRLLNIATAANAGHALNLLESTRFDLFILDLDLHNRSGFEFLAVLDQRFPYVPVILTTAADINSVELTEEVSRIRQKGIWHLLEKPFPLERLNGLIEENLDGLEQKNPCLPGQRISCNQEKRKSTRQALIQTARLNYEELREGMLVSETFKVIMTDVSSSGVGLLTQKQLQPSQVVRIQNAQGSRCGVVAWSAPLEDQSCRIGIHFC